MEYIQPYASLGFFNTSYVSPSLLHNHCMGHVANPPPSPFKHSTKCAQSASDALQFLSARSTGSHSPRPPPCLTVRVVFAFVFVLCRWRLSVPHSTKCAQSARDALQFLSTHSTGSHSSSPSLFDGQGCICICVLWRWRLNAPRAVWILSVLHDSWVCRVDCAMWRWKWNVPCGDGMCYVEVECAVWRWTK